MTKHVTVSGPTFALVLLAVLCLVTATAVGVGYVVALVLPGAVSWLAALGVWFGLMAYIVKFK